jgi:hypothetical protein
MVNAVSMMFGSNSDLMRQQGLLGEFRVKLREEHIWVKLRAIADEVLVKAVHMGGGK